MRYNDLYSDNVYGPYFTFGLILLGIFLTIIVVTFTDHLPSAMIISFLVCGMIAFCVDRYIYYFKNNEK